MSNNQATTKNSAAFLGVNIYLWERLEQNRLIVELLGPLLERLQGEGLVDLVFYDRFDTRGPHVFLSVGLVSEARDGEVIVQERIEAALEPFLAARAPSEIYDESELAELHEQCRGKALWHADRRPGLAADRTYLIDSQAADGYPFLYWSDFEAGARARISALVSDSTVWALSHLRVEKEANMAAAVNWCADFDCCLRRLTSPAAAADYWRFHASTLIMGLSERWLVEPEAVRASLPGRVAAKTATAFEKIFRAAEEPEVAGPWPNMAELVARVLEGASEREGASARQVAWRALREVHHVTWKQLGLYVRFHLPIVLFAWNRNLELSEQGTAESGTAESGTAESGTAESGTGR